MQLIILYFLSLLIVRKFFVKYSFFETISLSILLFVSQIGTLPFFLNEYLNFTFDYSLKILVFSNLLISILLYTFIWSKKVDFKTESLTKLQIGLIIFAILLTMRGFFLPVRGWDAYSMYDGRAHMLTDGLKIKDMVLFNKYDDFNYMYYVSYPPMTSIAHSLIYSAGFNSPMFLYSLLFISVLYIIYSILMTSLNKKGLVILFILLSCFAPSFFDQVNVAYTNLVAVAFQIGSIYMALKYNKSSKLSDLLTSAFFLSVSNWTRNLEPIFLAIYLGLLYFIFTDKVSVVKKLERSFLSLIVVVAPIIFWKYYILANLGNIGGTSQISLLDILSKLPDSLYINNIIEVIFFVYRSLLPIKYYFVIFFISLYYLLKQNRVLDKETVYFVIMIVASVAVMVAGTFYFSVSYSWWSEISGSFLRSNLILIPLITLFASRVIKSYEK